MDTVPIERIVSSFKNEYGVNLSKMPRKKIIYAGNTKSGVAIVVAMPASTIYSGGNGWVDFTKIQIDIFKEHKIAIAIFRLCDGSTHYIDMQELFPLLTQKNMMENNREGLHWKIDVWPNKIVIRNGGETLHFNPNERQLLNRLVGNTIT